MLKTVTGWVVAISLATVSAVTASHVYDSFGEIALFVLPVNFMLGWIIRDIEIHEGRKY